MESNQSVLQQLSDLSVNYLETGPQVQQYCSERGLSLPPPQFNLPTASSQYVEGFLLYFIF
jgi:hypothetical protein